MPLYVYFVYLLAALEEEEDESPFSWMVSPFCWTSVKDWRKQYQPTDIVHKRIFTD